jgi:nitrogen-specific signal transduction histidine kinase
VDGDKTLREDKIITSAGEIRDVSIVANIIKLSGKRIVQGVFRDITDAKRAEKERDLARIKLFHSEKLASVGMLVSGVAHEINNPLSIIIGFNAILESKIKAGADGESLLKL